MEARRADDVRERRRRVAEPGARLEADSRPRVSRDLGERQALPRQLRAARSRRSRAVAAPAARRTSRGRRPARRSARAPAASRCSASRLAGSDSAALTIVCTISRPLSRSRTVTTTPSATSSPEPPVSTTTALARSARSRRIFGLEVRLRVLGVVVLGVLLQVAEIACGLDPLGDRAAALVLEPGQLGLERGEPFAGDLIARVAGHQRWWSTPSTSLPSGSRERRVVRVLVLGPRRIPLGNTPTTMAGTAAKRCDVQARDDVGDDDGHVVARSRADARCDEHPAQPSRSHSPTGSPRSPVAEHVGQAVGAEEQPVAAHAGWQATACSVARRAVERSEHDGALGMPARLRLGERAAIDQRLDERCRRGSAARQPAVAEQVRARVAHVRDA